MQIGLFIFNLSELCTLKNMRKHTFAIATSWAMSQGSQG